MRHALFAATGFIVILALAAPGQAALTAPQQARPAPAFTHERPADWINSKPLTLESLRGQVVLLNFWTFACWNCYRSFPWLNELQTRLQDRGLRIVGVHTPEFDHEKVRANIEKKIAEFGLRPPVMMDNDYSYWNALDNRYWPAFYLIDKKGRVRAQYAGETHAGDAQARRIEADLQVLLNEAP